MRRTHVQKGGTFRARLGAAAGPSAPAGADRFRFTVGDPEGRGCDTAVWILRALHRLDASVWVEHGEAGSLRIAERGRGTLGGEMLWTRFHKGQELTGAAAGPEAEEALEACAAMVSVPPYERRALYRERYAGRGSQRSCKVCEHPGREMLDEALKAGRSPRSLRTDYPGLSRVEIAAHRDGCMEATPVRRRLLALDTAKLERAEATEAELNRLIERRSDKSPDPDELEPSYAENVRRFNARKREANRAAWCEYFGRLAGSLRSRAEEYDERAAQLLKGGHE